MPGWLRSAWLAACVATSCVGHQAPPLPDQGGSGAGGGGSAGAGGSSFAAAAGSVAAGAATTGGKPIGGTSAGGTPGGTEAGSATGGTTGGSGGSGGVGGSSGGGGASNEAGAADVAGAAGAVGEPSAIAIAKLEPVNGSMVTGVARFEQTGEQVKLSVKLTTCPAGGHALHLHVNLDCRDDANASGGNWSPQGEGIDEITCAEDGTGALEFTPPAGTWSIGVTNGSDLLKHSVVLHAGATSEPASRIACGLPLRQP